MRIQIITDAWHPQINGVVRTLTHTAAELERLGHRVGLVTPAMFTTIPCPGYSEIRLSVARPSTVGECLERFRPEAVHIATEGPLGMAARIYCGAERIPFTTSFHTRFPEYIRMRWRLPANWGYAALRRFHAAAKRTLVPTEGLREELAALGFGNLAVWVHGVDTRLFRPRRNEALAGPRPMWLYVGRVAPEKNIEAFLELDLPGIKYVVGDGPSLPELRRRFPAARYLGCKTGEELAEIYARADALVFPSVTDTFGNVILEALACGVPVAAFPVRGPKDILEGTEVGALDADLGKAARAALHLSSSACRAYAEKFTLAASAEQFLNNLWPSAHWRSLVQVPAA
ncbi:MAG TPA: glycosyltransferase family 1 protein [Alphaproteobacteria bacterium]|jgi:glycosyltransferase involved in cell wall biosynthesis|nr:glycosyltransferase family 1 protein [Alphaproteobacteria bacterium]